MSPTSSPSFLSLGLGYLIAISVGLLLLLASLLLSSYLCFRRRRRFPAPNPNLNPNPNSAPPRIIFITDSNSDEENQIAGDSSSSPIGLHPSAIGSYPKFPFSARSGLDPTCAICLCEYKENEMLRVLPDCRHYFHVMCVDAWLRLNASCPVCRTSPMPTPVSTPLSELVPLAQFDGERRRR